MKKYYKCLSENNGRLSSCVLEGDWEIIYPTDQWIKPKKGKIFIFTSKFTARKFLKEMVMPPRLIYLCEATGVIYPSIDFTVYLREWQWTDRWNKWERGECKEGSFWRTNPFPTGTRWADSIKLIKQVYPNTP